MPLQSPAPNALSRLGNALAPCPASPPAIPSQLHLQLSTPLKTHRPKHPAPTAPPASFLRLYPNRSPSTATTAVLHLSGAVSDRDLTLFGNYNRLGARASDV